MPRFEALCLLSTLIAMGDVYNEASALNPNSISPNLTQIKNHEVIIPIFLLILFSLIITKSDFFWNLGIYFGNSYKCSETRNHFFRAGRRHKRFSRTFVSTIVGLSQFGCGSIT
jgi:hypothetical protein